MEALYSIHNILSKIFLKRFEEWIVFSFYIDQKIADEFRKEAHCVKCRKKTKFLKANYARKPRGIPNTVSMEFAEKYLSSRFSFLCVVCKKRHTPASIRYFGRKVYIESTIFLFQFFFEAKAQAPRKSTLDLDAYPCKLTRKRWPWFFAHHIWFSMVGKEIRSWLTLNPISEFFLISVYKQICCYFSITDISIDFFDLGKFFKTVFFRFKKISIPRIYNALFYDTS